MAVRPNYRDGPWPFAYDPNYVDERGDLARAHDPEVTWDEYTREMLAHSPRWNSVMKTAHLERLAVVGPIDMTAWSNQEHLAVRDWAHSFTDEMPAVLETYAKRVGATL